MSQWIHMGQKIVFWDWTGTLADESKLDEAVCTSMERDIAEKENISFEDAVEKFKDHLKNLENTWQWHDYTLHCRKFGLDWKDHQKNNLDMMVLLPHAKEILEYVREKGYKNILCTNAVRKVILLRMKYAGVAGLFDGVIACDDVKAMKSEGKHFEKGLRMFGGDAKSSFSVGDNPVQDILPAKRIGMKAVYCEFGKRMTHYHTSHISNNHTENVAADFSIKDLLEIRDIIR